MEARDRMPLARVWAAAGAVFFISAWASRSLTQRASAMPSYWVGLIGLLAIGVALFLSWRGLADPSAHSASTRRLLRGAVVLGVVLWCAAMVFPFL